MYPAEKRVLEVIGSVLDTELVPNSHRNNTYKGAINYLKHWSTLTDKVLIAYEVKLNSKHRKYPDFFLIKNTVPLRIEVKDCGSERRIAEEINSLGSLDSEMWYVIDSNKNIDIIEEQLIRRNKKLKIFHTDKLSEKLKEYYS